MTTPKRGVKVVITTNELEPVKIIRKHRPRNGGGLTLAEFTNRDGRGVERAQEYIEEKGHSLV